MKGESNATAPNWFLCSRAGVQGDMCCAQLLPRSCSCCGQPAWHSQQSHATHPGFAQTNELAQTAEKHPVYSPDNGGQEDLEQDLLQPGTNHSLLLCSAKDPK